ncbi:hypothetical protein ACJZ2D_014509 [Fusarium nematophilum]
MDPASLAFGVVSLAMQLVQTTSAIRKLIGAYKSAAKELTAMSDKLDDIETICHSLEIILDNFEAAPRSWETSLLLKLHKTIDGCRGKASQIHDVIIKVVSRHNERRNPLNTLGALFLQHRDQLRQCNDELDQALNMKRSVTSRLPPVPSTFIVDHAAQATPIIIQTSPDPPRLVQDVAEVCVKHWTWRRNTAYLRATQKRKVMPGLTGPDSPIIQNDVVIDGGVPLLNLYVRLSLRRGFLSPLSISLQFPHVINLSDDSEYVGDKLLEAMFYDDLEAIKSLFTEGSLTVATKVTWAPEYTDDDCTSLIGCAATKRSYSICQFLIDQSRDPWREPHMARSSARVTDFDEDADVKCALAYINLRKGSLAPFEFMALIDGAFDADYVKDCIDLRRSYTYDDWAPFNLVIWRSVIDLFRIQDLDVLARTAEWASIVQEAISRGLDIHTNTWPRDFFLPKGSTALRAIMTHYDPQEEVHEKIHYWVNLLEQAGVDIQQYLDVEIEHCVSSGTGGRDGPYNRTFIVRSSGDRRLPCWVETVDDSGPDLFIEFSHLNYSEFFSHVRGLSGILEPRFARKYPRIDSFVETDDFPSWPVYPPFERPDTTGMTKRYMRSEEGRNHIDGINRVCDLVESRFQRKQAKKRRKNGLWNWELERQMPGAWVEEL